MTGLAVSGRTRTLLALPRRARTSLSGTGALAVLAVRRDRTGLAAAVYVITAVLMVAPCIITPDLPTPVAIHRDTSGVYRRLYAKCDPRTQGFRPTPPGPGRS